MEMNPTPLTKLNERQLVAMLQSLCDQHGLKLWNGYDGYELEQLEQNKTRKFVWETVDFYKLDSTNMDDSGQHGVRILHANGYDDYNVNTLKKNLRNAIRLLNTTSALFDICEGCELCEDQK